MLSQEELAIIDKLQEKMRLRFSSVETRGKIVRYLGKNFVVYKNVFWPFEDSRPLVEGMQINKGDAVLDVGAGSGVLSIFAACKGAGKVVALDTHSSSLKSIRKNARCHHFADVIEARKSDVFSALKSGERFDVVLENPPFRNKMPKNICEAAQWDGNFSFHKKFFKGIKNI